MKITYISHACLLIDTGRSLIATDPWLDGPAFCDQWNVFPKPVDAAAVLPASNVLLSHPHEDHLHEPTLRRICQKPKKIFYPFYWYPETIGWLRSLGLGEVVEARCGKSYPLDSETKVTFVGAPGQNSIIVLESAGEIFVNVNDALHSEAPFLIDMYVRQIRRRWPNIDVVFCGFGGASYYPNALHSSRKDDRAIARLREQLFIHNFCRIVHGLAPRLAIPFAADFVLLAPHQRWINDVRFSREDIPAYYQKHFSDGGLTKVCAMYPGDRIVDSVLQPVSPYRDQLQKGRLDHMIAVQYPEEVSAFRVSPSSNESTDQWRDRLATHLDNQTKFHSQEELRGIAFSLRLKDLPGKHWFNIRWNGTRFDVDQTETPVASSTVKIETTTSVLETSTQSDWGGDAMTIGYACDVTVLDSPASGNPRLCVGLLTRYPRPASYALRYPLRTFDFLCQSAPMVVARLKDKISSQIFGRSDVDLVTSFQWLTGNVEAIRSAYRLPEVP